MQVEDNTRLKNMDKYAVVDVGKECFPGEHARLIIA